jgi:hypothetical protein
MATSNVETEEMAFMSVGDATNGGFLASPPGDVERKVRECQETAGASAAAGLFAIEATQEIIGP